MGWRYQIPQLLELGYRVICPDLMGFGGTVRIFESVTNTCSKQLFAGRS